MNCDIEAIDRATGAVLAALPSAACAVKSLSEWKLAKRIRSRFILEGGLTPAQAACASYRVVGVA